MNALDTKGEVNYTIRRGIGFSFILYLLKAIQLLYMYSGFQWFHRCSG
jgi:hypothetical protein